MKLGWFIFLYEQELLADDLGMDGWTAFEETKLARPWLKSYYITWMLVPFSCGGIHIPSYILLCK